MLEKLDDLRELRLCLVLAGDVRERDLGALGVIEPGSGPAKTEDAGLAPLHLTALVGQEPDKEHQRQDADGKAQEDRASAGFLRVDLDAVALEQR